MYPGRGRQGAGADEQQQQHQQGQSQQRPQYPIDVNVQEWQDPSMYYAAHSTEFMGEMPANFPVGAAYNQELGWMEPFTVFRSYSNGDHHT